MLERQLFTTLFASLATMALSSLLPGAGTSSRTVLHGGDCHAVYPPEHRLGSGLLHLGEGLKNASDEGRYVVCGLPRGGGAFGGALDVEVSVTTPNPLLTCMVMSYDRFASSSGSTPARLAGGTGHRILEFDASVLPRDDHGSLHVACHLPPGAFVRSISLDQS
ncbi:MAG: hypothetical protein AAFZ18_34790 [Myxococcota bacterium]